MELPKKQLPRSLPRYCKPVGTFSCENSPFWGGTRGIVLLNSRVWKDVNGWALEIGISCTYSNPVVTGGRKHTHMFGLHNHIQICNLYTMSPANRNNDEVNPKLQHQTYVVLRVTTKYAFDHIVGLIQSYLTEMNMFVKEKEMHLAIIGMTADWCPVSLRKMLHKDLEHHVENIQTSSRVDTKFCHHGGTCLLAPEVQNADA